MASAHLVVCPSCARHVRVSEASCPFCASRLAEAVTSAAPRRGPTERLSRSALYAFGVGGGIAVAAACSSSSTTGNVEDSGTKHDAAADVGIAVPYGQPAYGGFPVDAGEPVEAGGDARILPPYGIPIDAGEPLDAATPTDALPDHTMGGALYGGPGV